MKFAIISDIHDNLVNLNKIINYCSINKIETIICCGDLASFETLTYLKDKFHGKIYFVLGNMDEDYLTEKTKMDNFKKENKNIKIFNKIGEFTIDKFKIAITHFPEIAVDLARSRKFNLVFFGHTHRPTIENIDNTTLLNPGTSGGVLYNPSFATFNTMKKKPELVLLNELY